MKLQRLFMLGLMVTSIALITSCSDGEDGAKGTTGDKGDKGDTGDTGDTGAAGADGIACWDRDGDGIGTVDHEDQGVNEDLNFDNVVDVLDCQGADGVDGSANATRVIVDVTGIADDETDIQLAVGALTQEVLDGNAIFAYLVGSSRYVPIPGRNWNGLIATSRHYDILYRVGLVDIKVTSYDGTDTTDGWIDQAFDELHLILLETSAMGGKSQADVMASLKAQGVDTTNYQEVMAFLKSFN